MKPKLEIQVHFDLICPWCFIGKRHLDAALARFGTARPDVDVDVLWVAHELLPDTPPEGLPYQAFYERRLGGPAAVAARRAQVQEAARSTGIRFAFDRIQRMPNTRLAHRLLADSTPSAAATTDAALIERLFAAYFEHGQDIGDPEILRCLACGDLADRAASGSRQRIALAERTTTTGVPLFIFNERMAVSGAQPPDALLEQMHRSTATHPVAPAAT